MSVPDVPRWSALLRKERIAHNWRQRDLADQLGTSVLSIQRWERGNQQPGSFFRAKLCTLFNKSAEELGFTADDIPSTKLNETESANARVISPSSSAFPALWSVPYPRNPFFTGREEFLELLHEQLRQQQAVALGQSYALSGLGGIGKTQVALEYAYRYARHYSAILWVAAENAESMIVSIATIARILQLPEQQERDQRQMVEAVKSWLGTHDKWLLLVDNIATPDLMQSIFPSIRQGHLLFTTRLPTLGMLAQTLEMSPMSLIEGEQLLLRRARSSGLPPSRERLPAAETAALEEIARTMDGLPLALDQAGAYIEKTRCRLADFLSLLRAYPLEILDERELSPDHPQSVVRTFTFSFTQVQQNNPLAAELLKACCFLAPDDIPLSLIGEGATRLEPQLAALADPLQRNRALAILRSYALINRHALNDFITIHRLVQAVIRAHMESQEQRLWAERIVRMMHQVLPAENDQASWPLCQLYLPQVRACATLIEQYQLLSLEAAQLLARAGEYLRIRGQYQEAESLSHQALTIYEQHLGEKHPGVARMLWQLDLLYYDQGKYEHGETLLRRALAIWEQQPEPDQLALAELLADLAHIISKNGRHQEAESFFIRALATFEQITGPNHPDIAAVLDNLAVNYTKQGKYEQAETTYKRALAMNELLGVEPREIAVSLNNLGQFLTDQGHYAEAKPLLLRALALYERTLGPEHSYIGVVLHNLGRLSIRSGNDGEAEEFLRHALAVYEKSVGQEHVYLALTLDQLGRLYLTQERYVEAEHAIARGLRICEQTVGQTHPSAAALFEAQGYLAFALGNNQEAEQLLRQALTIREQKLGANHPSTAITLYHYADLLFALQREQEAAQIETRAQSICQRPPLFDGLKLISKHRSQHR